MYILIAITKLTQRNQFGVMPVLIVI